MTSLVTLQIPNSPEASEFVDALRAQTRITDLHSILNSLLAAGQIGSITKQPRGDVFHFTFSLEGDTSLSDIQRKIAHLLQSIPESSIQ